MSDQSNEYNRDAPPRQNPESSLREGGYVGSANLVAMHHAQGGGNDSFPVLQAFQEYIDAERKQARKRVVQLSIGFAAILGMVVVGFLFAGVAILRNTTSMQTRLMEIVAAKSSAPVQMQPANLQSAPAQPAADTSAAIEESLREMSRALEQMRKEGAETQAKAAAPAAPAAHSTPPVAPPTVDPAVEALRVELEAMKAESSKMANELLSLREKKSAAPRSSASSRVVEDALARARKTGEERAAADRAAADAAAVVAANKRAEDEKKRSAQVESEKAMAAEMAAKRIKETRVAAVQSAAQPDVVKTTPVEEKEIVTPQIPAATKAPPVAPANVTSPGPPKNMKERSIALKMRDGAAVPWRIFVPE